MSKEPPAHELLLRLKEDECTLPKLMANYGKELHLIATKSRGLTEEDAEEAVQDTFERIAKKIHTYKRERRGGEAWMRTILYNVINDRYRKDESQGEEDTPQEKKPPVSIQDLEEKGFSPPGAQEDDPAVEFEIKESRRCKELAFSRLSEEDQQKIQLEKTLRAQEGKRGPPPDDVKAAMQRFFDLQRRLEDSL